MHSLMWIELHTLFAVNTISYSRTFFTLLARMLEAISCVWQERAGRSDFSNLKMSIPLTKCNLRQTSKRKTTPYIQHISRGSLNYVSFDIDVNMWPNFENCEARGGRKINKFEKYDPNFLDIGSRLSYFKRVQLEKNILFDFTKDSELVFDTDSTLLRKFWHRWLWNPELKSSGNRNHVDIRLQVFETARFISKLKYQ